jgi:hypothetical protein
MKALEQRVESLVGILATANNQERAQSSTRPGHPQPDTAVAVQISGSAKSFAGRNEHSRPCTTPEGTAEQPPADASKAYDPVDDGLLDEPQANFQLDEFRHSFTEQFPFVYLGKSRDAAVLRREQPFLFLSIMASTSYRTPTIQRILAAKFRDQIGSRISACTLRGLEILQGLLIHAAYYQYFYTPGTQHLAVVMQLCVAVAQNMGQSKTARTAHDMGPRSEMSAADKRALLGTYYLAAL